MPTSFSVLFILVFFSCGFQNQTSFILATKDHIWKLLKCHEIILHPLDYTNHIMIKYSLEVKTRRKKKRGGNLTNFHKYFLFENFLFM